MGVKETFENASPFGVNFGVEEHRIKETKPRLEMVVGHQT